MNRTIFLAEDDEDDIFFFEEIIQMIPGDFSVQNFTDGEKLIEGLNKQIPQTEDVIFLDLNMPCKNGIECLAEIRSNINWKNVPVVILSSSNYFKDFEDLVKLGANHFIRKKADLKDMKVEIEKILNTQSKDLIKLSLVKK